MGHAPQDVGDLYSKLQDDVGFRQEWVERVGLGFSWSTLVHKTKSRIQQIRLRKPMNGWVLEWSGRKDLNLQPPGPEPGTKIS
jgi:hypothetical protein